MSQRFVDIEIGAWFFNSWDQLCQRVQPLNSANTYNFTRATWDHTNLHAAVKPTLPPVHILPRQAGDECRGNDQSVLFWHPCGHYEVCKRCLLRDGEWYIPLSALPELPRQVHECKHLESFLKDAGQ